MTQPVDYHEQCQQVLVELPAAVMIGDAEGRIIFANPAAVELIGLPLDEIMQLDPRAMPVKLTTLDGKPVDPMVFPLGRVLRDRQKVEREEYRLHRPDGGAFVLSISARPLETGGFMFVARDMTREKEAEDRLRASEENFRNLSEGMSEGVVVVVDGKFYWSNRALSELFGYSREELTGKDALFFLEPPDQELFRERLARRLSGASTTYHDEIRVRHRDGHWVFLDIYVKSIRFDGRDAIQVVGRDVTEARRRREELMSVKLAVESTSDAIAISDAEGRITFINESFRRWLGYEMADLQRVGGALEPYDNRKLGLHIASTIRKGERWSGLARLRTRDGRIIPSLVRADAIRDAEGKVIGLIGIGTDIAEQEKSREALRQSEEKYRMLVEASTDAIFLETPDLRVLDCNTTAIEMFGYSKDEMLRLTVTDLIPPEDVAHLTGLSSEALSAGGFRLEARNMRKDGTIFPVEVNTRLFEMNGQPYVIVFIRDLTEQKRNQAALVERERFLANIFASIQDGLSILDTDLNILRVNPVMERWYEHALPLTGRKCFQAYHGRNVPCEVCPSIKAIQTQAAAMEISPKTGPGGVVTGWLEVYSFPLFDLKTGKISGVIEYVRDVTARKQAEEALASEKERLAVTLRSIGDGVITTDVEGRVVLMNQVAEKLCGCRQEDSLGRPLEQVFRIVNEFTREPVESPVEKVIATGGVVGLANHTMLVARDGTERAIADSGSPIRDRDSRIVGVVLVFRDVTQKRQAEEQMQKAEKLESLGILAGGIAHDFNNILTGILGNISLTRMSLSPGLGERLHEAEKACLRARDLTQQLLTFSRGGMPVKTAASIGEIIAESARFALRGSRASLELDLEDGLWPAEVDVGQISQVVHNLVLNADQAMPSGGVIRVRGFNFRRGHESQDGPALRPGDYVCAMVTDSGVGIPPENLKKIFDPFFSTKETGSGIGLTTSYSIVTKHDGYILVESMPGRGSKFTVYLPAAPGRHPVGAPVTADLLHGTGRVLLMDDEDAIRELGELMLSELGYEPATAKTGEEALQLFTRARDEGRPFAVVILDLTVPGGMGGQETLVRLRAIDPEVKAVVSSGYSTDPVMSSFRSHGFAGFITKPYDVETMGRKLHRLLHP